MMRTFLLVAFIACLPATSQARSEIQPHPRGCPKRAFCGCGASVNLFGQPIRDLFLARNWLRFPRAAPAHNMVGVRRGHVFVLKQHVRDDIWLVFDANSGGGRTRLHERSIRGYAIVNPAAAGQAFARAR